nr:circularly permuted type 2 ATP-grasp protein [Burkholderiaceae bacterium]
MPQSQSQSSLPFGSEELPEPGAAALLHSGLPPEPGFWDEMRSADGRLREAWQAFARWWPADGAGADAGLMMERGVAQLARQIRHDGITHNVFSEQGAAQRPWSLELLPLLIDADDWACIEAGVEQRAQLMQAMLVDAYGAQRMLHEGLFPPALLMRHPGYLRALHGVEPASGLRLHLVAFD